LTENAPVRERKKETWLESVNFKTEIKAFVVIGAVRSKTVIISVVLEQMITLK
jgi:hypothetical protein